MLRSGIFVFMFLTVLKVFSQEPERNSVKIKASFDSFVSSGKDLPFWITSNRNGIFSNSNPTYQIAQFGFEKEPENDSLKKLDFFYGTNLVYTYSSKSDFQFNQFWAGSRYRWIVLKVGAQSEPVLYSGLSSTNGNMDWSNNARPLPGATLSTDGFIPFFCCKKWFSLKALYAEHLFWDNRYVENAHLHHKYVIGRAAFHSVRFSLGLDHWVYWGGISPDFGKLPGLDNYFRYIVGLKGGSNSPNNERANVLGNSLGMYLFTFEKQFRNTSLTFYYNHPFEDRSGLEMDNAPDGLWGLCFHQKNRKSLFTDFLYEFMNTTNQSGTYNMVQVGNRLTGRGNDNYFNNFIYKSGHVHYNRMMGTPFFVPVINSDNVSMGFDNTRIILHHLGMSGWINEKLKWKSLVSWSKGFGTYDPNGMFPEPKEQLSFLTEGEYRCKNSPLNIKMGIAFDYGKRFEKRAGGYAGIAWLLK